MNIGIAISLGYYPANIVAASGGPPPGTFTYLRPDGSSYFFRPDGTSFYLRP